MATTRPGADNTQNESSTYKINSSLTQTKVAGNFPDLTASFVHIEMSTLEMDEFENIAPPVLPPEMKPITDYVTFNKKPLKDQLNEDRRKPATKLTSAHPCYPVKEAAQFDHANPDEFSYAKFNLPHEVNAEILTPLPENPIWELEAACVEIGHYLAPDKMPQSNVIQENYKPIGIESKAIPNYKPVKEVSLCDEDVILDIPNILAEWHDPYFHANQNRLKEQLNSLIKIYDSRNLQPKTSSWSTTVIMATNYINSCRSNTAITLKPTLEIFLKEDCYSPEKIKVLLNQLKLRLKHLKSKKDINASSQNEISILEQAIANCEYIYIHPSKIIINDKIERKFRLIDKLMRKHKIEITEENRGLTIRDILRSEQLPLTDIETREEILKTKINDVRKFRIHLGNGRGLEMARIEQDSDRHARNMDIYGNQIDGDHFHDRLLFYFTSNKLANWIFRKPGEKTFIFTAQDSRKFPVQVDASRWYHPGHNTVLSKSVVDTFSLVYTISENLFSEKQNAIYAKLNESLLFHTGKFEVDLKFLLTDIEVFKNLIALHLRENWHYFENKDIYGSVTPYLDNNGNITKTMSETGKKIFDVLVQQEVDRLVEVRNVLTQMPEFSDFLTFHGQTSFNHIMEEIDEHKKELIEKNNNKNNPIYENLISLLNNKENFQNKYNQLCSDTFAAVNNATLSQLQSSQTSSQPGSQTSSQVTTNSGRMTNSANMNISQNLSSSTSSTSTSQIMTLSQTQPPDQTQQMDASVGRDEYLNSSMKFAMS